VNATETMKDINTKVHSNSNCRTLWASPRMSYDYITAIETKTDIITMQIAQIKKIQMFEKNLDDYSLETVKTFYEDAKFSGFKI
jgi:transaldolase